MGGDGWMPVAGGLPEHISMLIRKLIACKGEWAAVGGGPAVRQASSGLGGIGVDWAPATTVSEPSGAARAGDDPRRTGSGGVLARAA